MDFTTKHIKLSPQRNQLAFNKFNISDYIIINSHLKLLLQNIYNKLLSSNIGNYILQSNFFSWNFKCNEYNWIAIINIRTVKLIIPNTETYNQNDIIKYLGMLINIMPEIKCVYLKINDDVIINSKFIDKFEIIYHPLSFRQTDDNISENIISYFEKYIKHTIIDDGLLNFFENLILIGGECNLFGKIFTLYITKLFLQLDKSKNKNKTEFTKIFYTDNENIYNDCKVNHPDSISHLINFKNCNLDFNTQFQNTNNKSVVITNTSINGLGNILSLNMVKNRKYISDLFIISCNEKTFLNDYHILQDHENNNGFHIKDIIKLETNYCVSIYKLS